MYAMLKCPSKLLRALLTRAALILGAVFGLSTRHSSTSLHNMLIL